MIYEYVQILSNSILPPSGRGYITKSILDQKIANTGKTAPPMQQNRIANGIM